MAKIKVNALIISEALRRAMGVIEKITVDSIYGMVYIKCVKKKKWITVSGSDSSLDISYSFGALDVDKAGEICLDAGKLYSVCKSLKDSDVVLDTETGELTSDKSDFKFATLPFEQYPVQVPPDDSKQPGFVMSQKDLYDGLKSVAYAQAANNDARGMLKGVNLDIADNVLTLTATDGRRAARWTINDVDSSSVGSVTFPTKTAKLLQSVVSSEEGPEMDLVLTTPISIFFDSTQILSPRIDSARYPNCDSFFVPSKDSSKFVVNAKELLANVKRAKPFTTKIRTGVTLDFIKKNLTIGVSANPAERTKQVIPIFEREGDDQSIILDVSFLIDVLTVMGDVNVDIYYGINSHSVLFMESDFNGIGDTKHVIQRIIQ